MQRPAGKQDPTMRGAARTLAVASAIIGMGLTALPAAAQTQVAAGVAGKAHAQRSAPGPTAAPRKALERAKRLLALRNQHDRIKFTAACGANGFATRWYKNARTEFGGRFVHSTGGSARKVPPCPADP